MAARGPHNNAITWLPYTRVAWGGTLGDQGEIWTNSLRFSTGNNAVITPTAAGTAAPDVWAALATWIQSTDSKIGGVAKLTWLKINAVAESGLQYSGDTNFYAGTEAAGVMNTGVPLFQTFALTLRTQLKRGRGHVGRIFPPVVQPALNGTVNGRASVADASTMAASFATCMQAMQLTLRTAVGVGGFAVFSPGNSTKGTAPTSNLITSVECDTIPDVQHRRTNRLARQIGTVAVIAG